MLTEDQARSWLIVETGLMKREAYEAMREAHGHPASWGMRRTQIAREVALSEINRLAEAGMPIATDALGAEEAVSLARQLRDGERASFDNSPAETLRESGVPVRTEPVLHGPSRRHVQRQREAMATDWHTFLDGLPVTDEPEAAPISIDALADLNVPLREGAAATPSSPRDTARAVLADLDQHVPADHEDRPRIDALRRRGAALAADEAEEIVKLGRRHLALPPIMGGND